MAHITGNDILLLKAAMNKAGLLTENLDVPEWDSALSNVWTAFVTRQGVDYSIASQQPVHIEQIEQYIDLDRSFMDEITGAIENLGDSIDSVATEAIAAATEKLDEIEDAVEDALDPVLDKIEEVVDAAVEKVEELVEDVQDAIEDWTTEDDEQKVPDADKSE